MPIYEYECSSCRYYAELIQKISDRPLKKCPSCGKSSFKKLLSAPVFRLKGSGWYETDFKSDAEGKRNLAASDKDEAASAAKTEVKPEAKTEGAAAAAADGAKAETKPESKPAAEPPKAGSGVTRKRKARSGARPAARKRSRRRGGR